MAHERFKVGEWVIAYDSHAGGYIKGEITRLWKSKDNKFILQVKVLGGEVHIAAIRRYAEERAERIYCEGCDEISHTEGDQWLDRSEIDTDDKFYLLLNDLVIEGQDADWVGYEEWERDALEQGRDFHSQIHKRMLLLDGYVDYSIFVHLLWQELLSLGVVPTTRPFFGNAENEKVLQ